MSDQELILIFDNGLSYDGHAVDFIAVDGMCEAEVEMLYKLDHQNGSVLGRALVTMLDGCFFSLPEDAFSDIHYNIPEDMDYSVLSDRALDIVKPPEWEDNPDRWQEEKARREQR